MYKNIVILFVFIVFTIICNAKVSICYDYAAIITKLSDLDKFAAKNTTSKKCKSIYYYCINSVTTYKDGRLVFAKSSCGHDHACRNITDTLVKIKNTIIYKCYNKDLSNNFKMLTNKEKTLISIVLNKSFSINYITPLTNYTTSLINYSSTDNYYENNTTIANGSEINNSLLLFFTLGCYLYNFFANKF